MFGNVLLGPTAEDVADRSDTATSAPGWRRCWPPGGGSCPDLVHEEVTATYAGLRAATEHPDYQMGRRGRRYVRVAGIRSTGLTASLGIAEHVAGLLGEAGLSLKPRGAGRRAAAADALPRRGRAAARTRTRTGSRPTPRTARSPATASGSPAGEIRDALASDIPPADLDGLRRRTRAMNGRCQAFYCGAAVSAC